MANSTFPALGRKIGEGGMGSVYSLANDPTLALKIMEFEPDRLSEAVLTSHLLHPDIIHAKRVYFDPEKKSVGMLLKRALPLDAKYFPREWTNMRNILLQAVCGIEQLHKSGILHLDIKPSNMLLLDEGGTDLIITDFGLSAPLHASTFGGERGTLGFYKKPYEASVQTDLEALVVSLWLIITTWITGIRHFTYDDQEGKLTSSVSAETKWPHMALRLSKLQGVQKAAAAAVALSQLAQSGKKLSAAMIRRAILSHDRNDYYCPDLIVERNLRQVLDKFAKQSLDEDDFITELAKQYKDFRPMPGLGRLARYVLHKEDEKQEKQEKEREEEKRRQSPPVVRASRASRSHRAIKMDKSDKANRVSLSLPPQDQPLSLLTPQELSDLLTAAAAALSLS